MPLFIRQQQIVEAPVFLSVNAVFSRFDEKQEILRMQSHDDIDRRGLTMAREIVARIDADPTHAGLTQARNVCERWVSQGVGPAAQEWQGILLRSWDDVRRILLDESEEGTRLRQNSPFCGILSPRERWTFFRKEGNRETART